MDLRETLLKDRDVFDLPVPSLREKKKRIRRERKRRERKKQRKKKEGFIAFSEL